MLCVSWDFAQETGAFGETARTHALRMDEAVAEELAADIPTENPGWEAKVVKLA